RVARRRLGMRAASPDSAGEGDLAGARAQFPAPGPGVGDAIEARARTALRLPSHDDTVPGDRPVAPEFTAAMLDKKERFDLAATRGRPVLLLFFLHTCPHCHEALVFLKSAMAELPEDKRPLLVGLELTGRADAV